MNRDVIAPTTPARPVNAAPLSTKQVASSLAAVGAGSAPHPPPDARAAPRAADAGRCPDRGPVGAVRRTGRGGDVGAGAEEGIDQAPSVEYVERPAVVGEMLGLAAGVAVPIEAEPAQVVEDRRLEFAAGCGGCRCPRCAAGNGRPASRARCRAMRAEKAWPRWSSPVGLGANRVTTVIHSGSSRYRAAPRGICGAGRGGGSVGGARHRAWRPRSSHDGSFSCV